MIGAHVPVDVQQAHELTALRERYADLRLLCRVAAIDQQHHRVRLGDGILDAVVVHGKSGDEHDALLAFRAQHAARVDGDAPRRCRRGQQLPLPIFIDGEGPDGGPPTVRLLRRNLDTTVVLTNTTAASLTIELTLKNAAGVVLTGPTDMTFAAHETKLIPVSDLLP